MAICTDCIAARDSQNFKGPPCEGFTVTVTVGESGKQIFLPLTVIDNPSSVTGFDYIFKLSRSASYTIIYDGTMWIVLNLQGDRVAYSEGSGSSNNLCPPLTGWTNINGEFITMYVDQILPPGPSVDCVIPNSTFDSDISGWEVTNGVWTAEFGGTIKYDTTLLCSVFQDNVLIIGETYNVSVSYYAPVARESCTPNQYRDGFIQISAGTNFYREELKNTINEPGQLYTISVELTCQENETLEIKFQDPNQCFATVSTARGIFIDRVCAVLKTNDTNPIGPSPLPSVQYIDTAEVPARVNGVDYNTKLLQFQECLAKKGTTFYNKIVGAVKCDYRELTKLKLIIGLLSQKNEDRSLDCIYDRVLLPTALYQNIPCDVLIDSVQQGDNIVVLDGDYSQFETFKFGLSAPAGFSSTIIDAVYDSETNTTEILLADEFPANATTPTLCLTQSKESTNTYLETFIDFANRFCSDCIVTGPAPTPITPTTPSLEITESALVTETGVQITTEFNQQITI